MDRHQPLLLTYLLRLADDNLVVAQRLGQLTAGMPQLEEDIAVANLALDHLGQARNFYTYATEVDPAGRDEDQFAMLRPERDFLNAVLVEQPNGDFAQTMVRQLFLDAYQVPLYQALASSADERLGGVAGKALKEARYHLEHSSSWVITLGDGTGESNRRAQDAVNHLWQFTADQFAADAVEDQLRSEGIVPDPAELRTSFDQAVSEVLRTARLSPSADSYQRLGGRTGLHTAHLGHLLPELQWLYQAHPGASW